MAQGPEPPALGERSTKQTEYFGLQPDAWWGVPGAPEPARPIRLLFSGVRAGYGGTQSGVENIIRHLSPDDFSVRILTGADDSGCESLRRYGEVFHVPDEQPAGLCRRLTRNEWVARCVRAHVWSWRPHLIFAWSGDLFEIERFGIPCLTRVRSLGGIQPEQVPPGMFCYRVSHVCPGEWPIMLPGVAVTPPPDERRRIARHVVRIGRADPDRHPEVFADALTLMEHEFERGMTVTVVGAPFYGDWDWAKELRKRRLDDKVRVAGHLPHEQAMAVMETAAVHVANAPESFGQATAEAMMRGVIPVVCDEGYGPTMVSEYGVAAPNTAPDMAAAISAALERSEHIFARHHTRTWAIRNYSSERAAREQVELFQRLAETPRVALVLPVRNHVEVTRKCIDSLLGNTHYANFSLSIIDDASEDETLEYLQRLADYDERVIVYHNREPHGGIKAAWEVAEYVDSPFVVFLNNDMLFPSGWLAKLVAAMVAHPDLGLLIPRLSDEEEWRERGAGQIAFDRGHRSVGIWRREALEAPDEDLASLQSGADNSMVEKMLAAGWRRAIHLGVELYHVGSLTRGEIDPEQLRMGKHMWKDRYEPLYDHDGAISVVNEP